MNRPPSSLKQRLAVALLAAVSCSSAAAFEAADCEEAAGRLRRATADLESTVSTYDEDRPAARGIAQDAASQASDIYDLARKVLRVCGGQAPLLHPSSILDAMRLHLMEKFGPGEATRARIKEVQPSLDALAVMHARVRPVDFAMTLAVAEAVFTSGL